MSLKSFATKGFSLAMNGKCNNHSKKASNYANKASNLFKSCRTTKDTNEKINKLAEGLIILSHSIKEVSDSVVPISSMNMFSSLLSENINNLLENRNLKTYTEFSDENNIKNFVYFLCYNEKEKIMNEANKLKTLIKDKDKDAHIQINL